jgi:pimeloyl-ACP methyl ester carboxylesterase
MQLNYKQYGKEYKTLVILHGLMGTLDNWQTLAKRWSEHFPVFVLDMRNHGKSPHSDEFSYDAMVEDVYEFCLEHDLREINLLGHSMGGKVAMYFALKYPELVDKLIVADIAPKTYPPGGHDNIFKAMETLPLDELKSRAEADEYMTKFIPSFPVRQFILKNLVRDEEQYKWKLNLPVLSKNYDKILAFDAAGRTFDHPTLFIKGEHSDYIHPDEFDDYKLIFPNAALKTIENTGHWLHAENPDLVYISVKVFAQLKLKEGLES